MNQNAFNAGRAAAAAGEDLPDNLKPIAENLYQMMVRAGITKEDMETIKLPDGNYDMDKFKQLFAGKGLDFDQIKKADDDIRGQLAAQGMSPTEVDSLMRARSRGLFDDKGAQPISPDFGTKPTGFGGGQPAPNMSKEDMQKLMMKKSLELKSLEYKRQASHRKLANQYGGLMQYRNGGGLNLLQPTSGLEQLLEVGRVLQTVSPQSYQEFTALLKHEPNVFMFSPQVMDTLIADLNTPEAAIPSILDLPFRTCLVEAYAFDSDTKQSTLCSVPAKGTEVGDFGMDIKRCNIEDANLILSVPILFIHEVTVAHYELTGFVHVLDKEVKDAYTVFPFLCTLKDGYFVNFRPKEGAVYDPTFASFATESMRRLVHRITNLQGYQSGTVKAAIRAKVKSGGQTYFHKIKQVIYLGLKQEHNSKRSVQGEPVDWSHRWEVRGHWRKVRGIGKDREGQYTVKGFAWVVPHVKGPEALPVIKKVRADMPPKETV